MSPPTNGSHRSSAGAIVVGQTLREQAESGELLTNFTINLRRVAFGFVEVRRTKN